MKSYTLEKLHGEPIVLGITGQSWDPATDITLWADELYHLLDALEEPVFYIGNLLQGNPWTLDEAIRTASAVARGRESVFHHPNIKEVLIVSTQGLVVLGAKGLQSDIFGAVRITVFPTVDEAFGYARSHQGLPR